MTWCVDQQRPDLTPRRLLRLDGGAARDGQRPQGFDARPLRVGGGLPGQNRPGGTVGVQTVSLALLAPLRRPGPVDLDDLDPGAGDRGRDPDTVAAGALVPDRRKRTVLDQPRDRSSVASDRGGELPVNDRLTKLGDDREVDGVLV